VDTYASSARQRLLALLVSLAVTFAGMRVYLHGSPNTDLDIGGYNIHHLFTGLVLLTLGGIPAIILPATHRWALPSTGLFGIGLALALDEWLYLIVTDGTNESYLLPVSFWGGLVAVAAAMAYAVAIYLTLRAHRE